MALESVFAVRSDERSSFRQIEQLRRVHSVSSLVLLLPASAGLLTGKSGVAAGLSSESRHAARLQCAAAPNEGSGAKSAQNSLSAAIPSICVARQASK